MTRLYASGFRDELEILLCVLVPVFLRFELTLHGGAVLFGDRKGMAAIKHATLHSRVAGLLLYFHAQAVNFVGASPCAGHISFCQSPSLKPYFTPALEVS